MLEIIGNVYGIFAIAFFVYAVIWNIRQLYYAVKCNGKSQCKRRDCHFGNYCDKREEVLSEEERELLYDLIAEIRNQSRTV